MSGRSGRAAVTAVVAAAAFGGCGGSSDQRASDSARTATGGEPAATSAPGGPTSRDREPRRPLDPCAVLARRTVEALLGAPLATSPASEGSRKRRTCRYRALVDDRLAVLAITVIDARLSHDRFERLVHVIPPGARLRRVADVGLSAYWETHPREPGSGVLSVLTRTGAVIVQILVPREDGAAVLRDAMAVGRTVVRGVA